MVEGIASNGRVIRGHSVSQPSGPLNGRRCAPRQENSGVEPQKSPPRRPRAVRFAPAEWAAVEAKAALAGMTPSRFIREAALGLEVKARRGAEGARLVHQLGRIGSNLNQLARLANARGFIIGDRIEAVLAEVLEAIGKL
jgi:hypothetical protein